MYWPRITVWGWLVLSASQWECNWRALIQKNFMASWEYSSSQPFDRLEYTPRVNYVALSKGLGTAPHLSFLHCKMGISPSALPSDQDFGMAKWKNIWWLSNTTQVFLETPLLVWFQECKDKALYLPIFSSLAWKPGYLEKEASLCV